MPLQRGTIKLHKWDFAKLCRIQVRAMLKHKKGNKPVKYSSVQGIETTFDKNGVVVIFDDQ